MLDEVARRGGNGYNASMPPHRIINGDCTVVLPTLDEAFAHSIVTDPPYHLTTGKHGGTGVASLNLKHPAGRSRIGTGFMGKAWDGGDVAFRPETWAEALRVVKPGGYLAAFGGTRTFHRMMVAIEDGGWEIRDTLMWVYGSGYPKSLNLDGDREGWGTALKPAWEPIVLARRPIEGTVEANVAKYGTGAINIGGCRAGGPNGRWPANLVHDGSDEVLAQFPQTESGQQAEGGHRRNGDKHRTTYSAFKGQQAEGDVLYGDRGSAARFFYCAKATREDRDDGLEALPKKPLHWSSGDQSPGTFQSPGTDRSARNNHPTVKPTDLMRWLCRLITPPGGTVLDPFMGSGSTGRGALLEGLEFVGIEQDPEYCAIARLRIAAVAPLFASA